MTKVLGRLGTWGANLNIIKEIYNKLAGNILNRKKLKVSPQKSETRQRYPPSAVLFNIVFEYISTSISEGDQGNTNKKVVKASLLLDDTIL